MKSIAQSIKDKTPPLWQEPDIPLTKLPRIVNVVSTTTLLAPGHCFNLKAITAAIPSSQYEPERFAAVIVRIKDEISTTAALVFKGGKIVVVHGLSPEHARFARQNYRLLFERISYPMRDPDTGNIVITSLQNRLVLDNQSIHNVVASGNLGISINLAALVRDAPRVCSWKPGGFPGLKFKVQLKAPSECRCKELKKSNAALKQGGVKEKCGCRCCCLLFENGNIVIIGVRDVYQANAVFFRIRHAVVDSAGDAYENTAFPLRKDQRHDARFAALLKTWGVEMPSKVKESVADEDVDAIIGTFIAHDQEPRVVASAVAPSVAAKDCISGESDFVRMCLSGQVNNVRMCLTIGSASAQDQQKARELLESLMSLTPGQQSVLKILQTSIQEVM